MWLNSTVLPRDQINLNPETIATPLIITTLVLLGTWGIYAWLKKPAVEIKGDKGMPSELVGPRLSNTESNLCRFIFFISFHTVGTYVIWTILNTLLYIPLGGSGFFKSAFDLILLLGVVYSVWDSFDSTTIGLNFRGVILYFGKPIFDDIHHGFTCLGLPKWIGTEILTVPFQKENVTIGLLGKDGKREPFIVEGNGFRAKFDVSFEYRPNSTRAYLKLAGDKERRVVAAINAVIFRFVQMPVLDEIEKVKLDKDGNEVKRFPNIDILKAATDTLSKEIMDERGPESAHTLLNNLGFDLLDIRVKDIENEYPDIVRAMQRKAAQIIDEETERIDLKNTNEKILETWKDLNMIGTPTELKGDDMISMKEAKEQVERKEGTRQTIELAGKAASGTFLNIDSSKKDRK
ncbi:MAG: hypothetical protein V4686_00270 [Patescibacteria group bacterium]